MKCTILDLPGGRKELYYGLQEFSGNKGIVYEVSEENIDLIRTCETSRIQEVINLICITSKRAYEISSSSDLPPQIMSSILRKQPTSQSHNA